MDLRKLRVALIAGLVFGTGIAQADPLPIGTLGATIPEEGLERKILSADLGNDQFITLGSDGYMVFFELFGLFRHRVDFEARLGIFLDLIEARMTETEIDPTLYFEDLGAFSRATRLATGEASGLRLAYQFDLVSAGDGLGYMVLSWSGQGSFQTLKEKIDQVIAGLQLPGEGSEWAVKTEPSVHSYEFGEWIVDLTFQDSIFSPSPESKPGERYTLSADEDSIAVHLFVVENDGDLDETMKLIGEAANPDGEYEELSSSDLELDAGTGRQVLLRSSQEGAEQDLALAAIELGEDRWIDLRMLSTGPAGHRDELWENLLRSMKVATPRDLDAYPIVEAKDEPELLFISEAGRRLMEASRFLGYGPATHDAVVGPDGGILQTARYSIDYLPVGPGDGGGVPETESLYTTDDFLPGSAVAAGSKVYYVSGTSEVSVVTEGSLEDAGFEAKRVTALGEDLLLARQDPSASLQGLVDLPAVGGTKLYRRTAEGEETLLLELPESDIAALAANDRGEALMAASPVVTDGEDARFRLLLMKAGGGGVREISRWRTVFQLTAAEEGWLVSGRPQGGVWGIHLVDGSGQAHLLVRGTSRGLALENGELTLLINRCLEPFEEGHRPCIYRAPLAAVEEHGARVWPFDTELFNRIGAKLRHGAPGCCSHLPGTREEVAALFADADAAARELVGSPIPAAANGLDSWFWAFANDSRLSEAGLSVAALVLADALLEKGGEWVPSGEGAGAPPSYLGLEERNPFAVGIHPEGVLLTLLYEEDNWYDALERIADVAEGRRIFLGSDPDAVRAKARSAAAPDLTELLRNGRTARLAELLEAQPENLFLRRHVYKHLAAFGHRKAVLELATAQARGENADDLDRVAGFAARLGGEITAGEAQGLVQELRDAIAAAPSVQELYLLLGQAYERSAQEDRLDKAAACYRKVVDLGSWTPAGREAQENLDGLSDRADEADEADEA